jgi:hypothetical protein
MPPMDALPRDYEAWKYCITMKCGIPLTREFIEKRLSIYNEVGHTETRRFAELYGSPHLARVQEWLARALAET